MTGKDGWNLEEKNGVRDIIPTSVIKRNDEMFVLKNIKSTNFREENLEIIINFNIKLRLNRASNM